MSRGRSDYVFPGYFETANKKNSDDWYESKVSKTFKMSMAWLSEIALSFIKTYPEAREFFSEFCIDTFNNKLTSHAGN